MTDFDFFESAEHLLSLQTEKMSSLYSSTILVQSSSLKCFASSGHTSLVTSSCVRMVSAVKFLQVSVSLCVFLNPYGMNSRAFGENVLLKGPVLLLQLFNSSILIYNNFAD